VLLISRFCGRERPITADDMTDEMEDLLASIRCDRLG
jgi:hypothetical protein